VAFQEKNIMLDILSTLDTWQQEADRPLALATVVATWGSSPRQPGAKMGIRPGDGDDAPAMIGSVSGGCVEAAVISEALEALADGRQRLLDFGVSDDTAWDVGLACGGKIAVFVEPLDRGWWAVAAAFVRADRGLRTAMPLSWEVAGLKVAVDDAGEIVYASPSLSSALRDDLANAARAAHTSGRTLIEGMDTFVDVYTPRPRLIIVGGAHVAMALKDFAHRLGFRVALIDPRRAFATPERFPDVELIAHEYPDKALPKIGLTAQTYLAILTHDPKIDDPALRAALPSPVAYIGILSSRKTHEKRVERLVKAGVDPDSLKRVRVPIGIPIGAHTPEEIALCIMAEIVGVRSGALARA
jgi:xanthine dehydrogenase accessory factor